MESHVITTYRYLLGDKFLDLLYISGGIICGSSILEINSDIDIFVPIKNLPCIYEFLLDKFSAESSSIITFNNRSHLLIIMKGQGLTIELLGCIVNPLTIINEVDFTVAMNYFDGKHLTIPYPDHLKNKRLVMNPNFRGTLDKKRLKKYLDRGYSIHGKM